jgi:hypothetical protein
MRKLSVCTLSIVLASACASDPYGYAPQYVPVSDEEPFMEGATEPSYEEVRRDPSSYQAGRIGWYGVVDSIDGPAASGRARVALSHHFHQERHLCADQFDSSCRVTVSQRAGGPFTAWVDLRPEDRDGRNRVYAGSLLKVYGQVTTEYDDRGGPVFRVEYYRHWPRGTYVTTGRSANMRR